MIGIIVKALWRAYPTSGMFAVCQPDVSCITPGTYAFLGAAAALSGVMRITLTVVVIMFELTGALTYILPTMIVLLVTKAVGDFLGTTGIADEMIRFNGFPFLDKDDHAYNVPVSHVMSRNLQTFPLSDLTIREIEETLSETPVKGFPITASVSDRTLVGYVERADLRYVIDKARQLRDINPDTPCSFSSGADDQDEVEFSGMATGPGVGMDNDVCMDIIESVASSDILKLWPWVNQTPITVSPQLPLEIAMQLFKRMGPRVILVEDHGTLVGLVTIKDVLKYTVTETGESRSAWNDPRFEGFVEETWSWTSFQLSSVVSWCRRVIRR